MKSILFAVALCAVSLVPCSAGAATAERKVGDLGKVGNVRFATSCDPALQADFDRGIALLHSFFYDEARRVFSAVAEKDPECAMAHWGVAMTYYHPLWAAPDSAELAAGGAAARRAMAAKKQNDRERGFVRAIEAYYKGLDEPLAEPQQSALSCHGSVVADPRGRAACFRREMEKVASANPGDVDADAFFALSLLGSAKPGDPKLENQKQAAQILEKWYAKQKNHPGLAHYLIHSYDYPPLADKGLPAARAYASIAPWVPHALHMPSHIFTRLGMWRETIESNLASAAAARRYADEYHPDATIHEELHSMDYALYGYLQTSQDAKAQELVARLGSIKKVYPEADFAATYAFGAMPARYALERRQWKDAANLPLPPMPFWSKVPFAEGHIVYARAVGAARSGDLGAARAAASRLGELVANSTEPRYKYFAEQMDIQREAALGLVALAEGKKDEAIVTLRRAAAREDSLGKHPVSPGAMLPVRELLAESLLETGRGAEALAEFKASLKINPGRFNGVYGAARAAAMAGDRSGAKDYYLELASLAKAGEERPELAEAKKLSAGK